MTISFRRSAFSTGVIFTLWLMALLVIAPILGVILKSAPLFFAPQYVFGLCSGVRPAPSGYGFERAISEPYDMMTTAAIWVGACVAFSMATRRMRFSPITLIAPICILSLVLLVHFIFSLFGYAVLLEGF